MNYFNDMRDDPEERRDAREEFIEMAEEEQIAEGDITVSETVSGDDPTPDVDDGDIRDQLEDEFRNLDEDDV